MTDLAKIAGLQSPGDSVRERRIELGWTQAELSEQSGISQADISRIENGRLDPRWSTIHRLSTALASDEPRKISLANGNRRKPRSPIAAQPKWAPKGPVQHIEPR